MELPEPLTPADEGAHPPDPGDALWNESWYLDWAAPDGSVGGYVRVGAYPALGVCWVWACLVAEGRPLVMAVHHHVPLSPGPSMGGPGVKADYSVGEEFGSVTVRLEAEAGVFADPTGPAVDTTTLRYDLTWETAGGVYPYPGVSRYEVPCRVRGSVWAGDEEVAVDTPGERDHSWGHRDWWSFGWVWTAGRLGDGTAFHATKVRIPGVEYEPGFVVPPEAPLRQIGGFTPSEELGPDGLPVSAAMALDGVSMRVAPLLHAPVPLVGPDGRVGRLARALCRFSTDDGRVGTGWTEWNQPGGGPGT